MVYRSVKLEEDCKLTVIGQHIKTRLNELVPDEYAGIQVVNTLYTIDYPRIPLHEYPVLKIFRLTSSHRSNSNLRQTRLMTTYNIAYPSLVNMTGLLNYVDVQFGKILQELRFDDNSMPYGFRLMSNPESSDFLNSFSELNQEYFAVIRWLFSIEENLE